LFASSILIATQSLSDVIGRAGYLYETLLYMDKFYRFMGLRSSVINGKIVNVFPTPPKITFDHVTFSYPSSNRKILNEISFEVNPGEKIAIW
jgi:ATP-binding cassette, subfamily B, bacterial